jgi:hypothetical protein
LICNVHRLRSVGMNGPSDDGKGIHRDYVHVQRRAA